MSDIDEEDNETTAVERLAKRNAIMKKIKEDYLGQNTNRVVRGIVRNMILIGRANTGKTTFKSMLVDPSQPPKKSTGDTKANTRKATVESFFIDGTNLILNIMDGPGLFEFNPTGVTRLSNAAILEMVETCINLEITKFHRICFVMALTSLGLQSDDIGAMKQYIKLLGPELSENACLILTHAESKTKIRREKMYRDLLKNEDFEEIGRYCKCGIFFTGCIDYDDYVAGEECILNQYKTVLQDRQHFLSMLSKDIEPVPIDRSQISSVRRTEEDCQKRIVQLERKMTEMRSAYENKIGTLELALKDKSGWGACTNQ